MSDDILKSFLDPRRLERIERISSMRTGALTVVLDRVHNAHNISAVLRSADAFGLKDVHVIGELDVSQGIALGADAWLNIHRHDSSSQLLASLEASKHSIAVTAPEAQGGRAGTSGVRSLPVFELPFEERIALVFGNEKDGVSPELFAAARYHAFIPMMGFVESLNISVACAICLFISTVRVTGAERQVPTLDEGERTALVSEWLRRNFSYSETLDRELERRKERKNDDE